MKNKKAIIGYIISGLISAQLAFSGFAKLFYESIYPQMPVELERIGLPLSLMTTLGILELGCVLIYLIPRTAVLGAVLLTGYMGGAMLTHLRIGEPVYMQFMIGVLAWLGIYLREPRLHSLLPLRK